MATLEPKLYSELEARGIIKQVTSPELATELSQAPITLYCGFDPTADSLHVGSLFSLLVMKRFQDAGHRVIAVVGGATGMIGDPSGKTQERSLLDEATLEKNLTGIRKVIERFLKLDGPNPARVVNNADWFKGIGYITFLRDVGKHFTVNHMLAKDSVRARLEDREHGISYTEFSYMLLQAYDFWHLYRTYGCRLQLGGSDQWGNITEGTELIRRMNVREEGTATEAEATPAFGLTWPLLTKSDGSKFGKTESGTIWLSAERTSPYAFHQYFLQTADADVTNLLRLLSFRPLTELEALEARTQTAPEKREAQHALADELTRLVYGEQELAKAIHASKALFSEDVRSLDEATLLSVFAGAPSLKVTRTRLKDGIALLDLLVESGLCASKGAARKEVQGGGIYLNNERMSDPMAQATEKNLIAGRFAILRRGKKTHHLIDFND
jgi:tyrosyl-tRNA synthetase